MSREDTQFKKFYNMEVVLNHVAEYLLVRDRAVIEQTSLRKVYDDVVAEYKEEQMPKYSTFRNYLIETLVEHRLYDSESGEKITSSTALRLLEIYIDDLELHFQEHPMDVIDKDIICCVLSLPDLLILDQLTDGIRKYCGGTRRKCRRTLLTKICRNIKKRYPEIIIAAIPESNSLITDKPPKETRNSLSDEDNPVFICSAICLYVVNSAEGKVFISSIDKTKKVF